MRKIINILLCILTLQLSNACISNNKYAAIDDNLFLVPAESDGTSDFALESLLIGKKRGKPLIVFLTGSGSYPLAAHAADSNYYFLFHPDIISDTTAYNYLFVSKPHIPAIAEMDEMDPETKYFNFNDDNELYAKFSRKNTVEYFVKNLPKLINRVKKQLRPPEIILMGHSQGARIVAEMVECPGINKFVYMSASPLGRMFYAGLDSTAYDTITVW